MPASPSSSLAQEVGITPKVLVEAAKRAHDLLTSEQLDEALVMAEGLVAADDSNGYYRTLLATTLFRRREFKRALSAVEEGLKFAPGHKDLTNLRPTLANILGVP
jgi:Flp pilus assembly protein TadD